VCTKEKFGKKKKAIWRGNCSAQRGEEAGLADFRLVGERVTKKKGVGNKKMLPKGTANSEEDEETGWHKGKQLLRRGTGTETCADPGKKKLEKKTLRGKEKAVSKKIPASRARTGRNFGTLRRPRTKKGEKN